MPHPTHELTTVWVSIGIWFFGTLVSLAITWGWMKTKISQHDKDIGKNARSIDDMKTTHSKQIFEFKDCNQKEHGNILNTISLNRIAVTEQYANINNFMGRVEKYIEIMEKENGRKNL